MKYLILFSLFCITGTLTAQQEVLPQEVQIYTATLPLAEDMREGAMVYGYDTSGSLVVLREGKNNQICMADDPTKEGISVACYSKKLEPFMSRGRELLAEGKTEMEKREIRQKESETGKLQLPDAPSMMYVLSGIDENYNRNSGELTEGNLRYVIYIPYATTESTGLPDRPHAPGMPWLMDPGTHRAHIMVTPPSQ
ncbi:hypothetical protein [Autumnicola psychrophila]|uniref:DUF4412 domain-containing protein n=1 Tax=Autumnicola psychrophila TaxID=3075592 RepID=A0ABU3DWC3_9FLAO|nr:hypothetical protein [Zunongwangia sp. F225]MDT0687749.1 hypothetical protein [Zunongwangia sp. F225]